MSPLPRSPAVVATALRRPPQASSRESAPRAQPSGESCTPRRISAPVRILTLTDALQDICCLHLHAHSLFCSSSG